MPPDVESHFQDLVEVFLGAQRADGEPDIDLLRVAVQLMTDGTDADYHSALAHLLANEDQD